MLAAQQEAEDAREAAARAAEASAVELERVHAELAAMSSRTSEAEGGKAAEVEKLGEQLKTVQKARFDLGEQLRAEKDKRRASEKAAKAAQERALELEEAHRRQHQSWQRPRLTGRPPREAVRFPRSPWAPKSWAAVRVYGPTSASG